MCRKVPTKDFGELQDGSDRRVKVEGAHTDHRRARNSGVIHHTTTYDCPRIADV